METWKSESNFLNTNILNKHFYYLIFFQEYNNGSKTKKNKEVVVGYTVSSLSITISNPSDISLSGPGPGPTLMISQLGITL